MVGFVGVRRDAVVSVAIEVCQQPHRVGAPPVSRTMQPEEPLGNIGSDALAEDVHESQVVLSIGMTSLRRETIPVDRYCRILQPRAPISGCVHCTKMTLGAA